jgi:hypothetical protein
VTHRTSAEDGDAPHVSSGVRRRFAFLSRRSAQKVFAAGAVGKELRRPRVVKFDYFRREKLYYTRREKGYQRRAPWVSVLTDATPEETLQSEA